MAANCEKLKVTLTGYDCLDLMSAIRLWQARGVTKATKQDLSKLYSKIDRQYHNNKRVAQIGDSDDKSDS